jgi:hypothetical protein
MPQFLLEVPEGVGVDAKQKMMRGITAAIDEAYGGAPDVRVWLREYASENVAQDGRINAEPIRPLAFLEAPELASLDARRKMADGIDAAIREAYEGLANTDEILVLMNHYPLEHAGWAGRLQSDNPEMVEAVKQLNG